MVIKVFEILLRHHSGKLPLKNIIEQDPDPVKRAGYPQGFPVAVNKCGLLLLLQ